MWPSPYGKEKLLVNGKVLRQHSLMVLLCKFIVEVVLDKWFD